MAWIGGDRPAQLTVVFAALPLTWSSLDVDQMPTREILEGI